MEKKGAGKNFYESVAAANGSVTVADVKKVFIWYDLFAYALPFQIMFIIINFIDSKYYPWTMLSVVFILLVDSIIKNSLERDAKNFEKFNKHIPIVKLWVVPLIVMGVLASLAIPAVSWGLI